MKSSFTLRFLQQADVIQLTDCGEGFCATLQLTAEVEVARPVPAHGNIIQNVEYNTVRKMIVLYMLSKSEVPVTAACLCHLLL